MMERIKIIVNAYQGKADTDIVEAEPIQFKGFEDFRFYIHRSYEASEMLEVGWAITEKSTGYAIFQGHESTKDEVIKLTEKKLSQITPEKLKKRIDKTIKIYGVVNE